MNPDLRVRIESYIESLFVPRDPVLAQNLADAEAAGLPQIQVSPNQGQLLYLLTKISGAAPYQSRATTDASTPSTPTRKSAGDSPWIGRPQVSTTRTVSDSS